MQSKIGTYLYYAQSIDYTIWTSLNDISSQQSQPAQENMKKRNWLMEYAVTHPNSYIRFHTSVMILMLDTYAAYLVITKQRSHIAGYYHLWNKYNTKPHPEVNGSILIKCETLKHVVEYAAKAETRGIFHNDQMDILIWAIPEGMNHTQPPTPIKTDNSTATCILY